MYLCKCVLFSYDILCFFFFQPVVYYKSGLSVATTVARVLGSRILNINEHIYTYKMLCFFSRREIGVIHSYTVKNI